MMMIFPLAWSVCDDTTMPDISRSENFFLNWQTWKKSKIEKYFSELKKSRQFKNQDLTWKPKSKRIAKSKKSNLRTKYYLSKSKKSN